MVPVIEEETKMTASDLVISSKGLSKSYGDIHALSSLDLKVPKNSIFAFLGPNGAGKTTTIKLLIGLTRPSGGGGVSPAASHRRCVAQMSSPRYARGAARKTLAPAFAAATAASTPAVAPPTTTTSTS